MGVIVRCLYTFGYVVQVTGIHKCLMSHGGVIPYCPSESVGNFGCMATYCLWPHQAKVNAFLMLLGSIQFVKPVEIKFWS